MNKYINVESIKNYDIISFDIFDTLISRNVSSPLDIFDIVELRYNDIHNTKISKFRINRIKCQKCARIKQKRKELLLSDIYDELSGIYGKKVTDELMDLELIVEEEYLSKKNDSNIYELLHYAYKTKKVIIVSDMYLPKKFILKILDKFDIPYHKLYLSSDVGLRKSDGSLFSYVLSDLKISSSQLCHFGDNKNSDYIQPKKLGIDAFVVKCPLYTTNNSNLSLNILNTFICNQLFNSNSNYYYKFGFMNFGPLVCSFCEWLHNDLIKNHISNVFFLSRDGLIIKNVFDILFADSGISTSYMYGSRRSLIVPSLWMCNNIEEMFDKMYLPKKIKLSSLLKKLGLDDYNLDELLVNYSLVKNKIYSLDDINLLDFLNDNIDLIITNSKKEYKSMKSYFNKVGFKGKVAIVDIGWYGNMQNSLDCLNLGTDIYGYYVGLNTKNQNQDRINIKGYLFDKYSNYDFEKKLGQFILIFEFLFMAHHGSVKRFVDSGSDVELYDYEYLDRIEQKCSEDINTGCVDFAKKYFSNRHIFLDVLNPYVYGHNLLKFGTDPSLDDVNRFSDFVFFDGEVSKLLDFKRIYLFNPYKFLLSFKNSKWKVGYLKKAFVFRFDYYKLYVFLSKIMKFGVK